MKGRTIRLLMMALGISGLAGAAAAQELEPMGPGPMAGEMGEAAAPMPARGFGRSAASARRAHDDEEGPAIHARMSHVKPGPRYDDHSQMRTRHAPQGPDHELARSEMIRLGSSRRKAIEHDAGGDEIRHFESEMDQMDETIAPRKRAAHTVQPPESRHASDAPMRSQWPRRKVKHKLAPFQDDWSGGKEQSLPSRDPRHAYRPRPTIDSDETPSIQVTPRGKAAPAAQAENVHGTPAELMAIERQIMVMKRKGASPEKIEPMEERAAALRAAWRKDRITAGAHVQEREVAPGATMRRSETVRKLEEPADPAPAPFWRGGNRQVDAPAADQEAEATYKRRMPAATSAEAPMEQRGFGRPTHL